MKGSKDQSTVLGGTANEEQLTSSGLFSSANWKGGKKDHDEYFIKGSIVWGM